MSFSVCNDRRPSFSPKKDQPRSKAPAALGWVAVCLMAPVFAVSTPALAEDGKLEVQLNKLEAKDAACRAFFVVNNKTATAYDTLKLDLVLFQTDGVIGKRLLVNLAPLKPEKRVIKQFDFSDMACDQVGSILVNDVPECAAASAPVTDCISSMTLTSLSQVPLTK